jgi:hypothetical protein
LYPKCVITIISFVFIIIADDKKKKKTTTSSPEKKNNLSSSCNTSPGGIIRLYGSITTTKQTVAFQVLWYGKDCGGNHSI